jgi:hypothetical protein
MSAYAPFLPSPLSISSSSSPPPPSSDPMLPSSPTPKSAAERERRERDRPNSTNPRAAAYKSQLSTRRPPPPHASASSSSSNSSPTPFGSSPSALSTRTRRTAQENSRAARIQVLRRHSSRGLPLLGDTVRDEPGGWVDGEWEEFDDDEKVGLELEMRKARREFEWRQRKLDELASEQGFPLEEEEEPEPEDDMMTEPGEFTLEPPIPVLEVPVALTVVLHVPAEPPLDVLLEDEPPVHSVPDYSFAADEMGSSPLTGVDSGGNNGGDPTADDDLAAFDHALVSSPFCPACGATDSPLGGDANVGLRCTSGQGHRNGQPGCGWGIEMPVLAPLREAFAAHG